MSQPGTGGSRPSGEALHPRADGVRWIVRGAAFALGAGAILLAGLVASRALGAVLLVFLGILLAAGLKPIVTSLRARFHLSRLQAIVIVYAVFFVIVLASLLVIAPLAIAEATRVAGRVPTMLDQAAAWAAGLRPPVLARVVADLVDAARLAIQRASRPPEAGAVVEAGITAAEVVISVATVLVVVAFWLVERARLQRYVLAFLPRHRRAGGRSAWNRVERRLGWWVRGQLILMALVGIAAAIAYQVIGLPSALLLGLFAGACEVIPLVGPLMGAVPAVLIALTLDPSTALVVIAAYVVIQLVEGNILVPAVMRNAVGISPLLVLVSLLVGAAAGGITGALVAVPIAATIEILLEPLQARRVPVSTEPRLDGDAAGDAEPLSA